jgi:hypothetical protein
MEKKKKKKKTKQTTKKKKKEKKKKKFAYVIKSIGLFSGLAGRCKIYM